MRTAIIVLAVLICAAAAVLAGLYIREGGRLRKAEISSEGSAASAGQGSEPASGQGSEAASGGGSAASSDSGRKTASASAASGSTGQTSKTSGSAGKTSETSGSSGVRTESDSESASARSDSSSAAKAKSSGASRVTPAANGHTVCLDAGHQDHGMRETEPNGPGSSTMKAKLTSGTDGNYSGVPEYEVNLEVAKRLRDELEKRGYKVIMTRETNDVELSNVDRAKIANAAGADIFIRIHCNSSNDSSVHGVLAYVPSNDNPYLSAGVITESQRLGSLLVEDQTAVTGQESRGLLYGDDMTGINWAEMPVSIIEMGFMSNRDEDLFLTSGEGQNLIMIGLANGIDSYFDGAG